MAKKKITPETSTLSATPAGSPVGSTPSPAKRRRAPVRKTQPATAAATAANATVSTGGNGKTHQSPSQAEIAEAAYYRHLKRGGIQGDEFNDWVEAERELRERRSR